MSRALYQFRADGGWESAIGSPWKPDPDDPAPSMSDPAFADQFFEPLVEELGGEALGLRLVRFPAVQDVGFDRRSRPKAGVPGPLTIDLPDAAHGFCGNAKGLGLVCVESDPGGGFRSWVRNEGIDGLSFKRIWQSDDEVLYDRLWTTRALSDPSILD